MKPNKEKAIKNILITQPRPESDKSPYYELARKYNLQLSFQPFIRIEGIPSKDFRKQKIDITAYSAVIFTSRQRDGTWKINLSDGKLDKVANATYLGTLG